MKKLTSFYFFLAIIVSRMFYFFPLSFFLDFVPIRDVTICYILSFVFTSSLIAYSVVALLLLVISLVSFFVVFCFFSFIILKYLHWIPSFDIDKAY